MEAIEMSEEFPEDRPLLARRIVLEPEPLVTQEAMDYRPPASCRRRATQTGEPDPQVSSTLPQSRPPAPNPASPFTPEEEERYLKMHWELLDFNDGKIPEPQYPMEDFLRFRRWQGWNLLKDLPERQQAYVDRLRKNGLL